MHLARVSRQHREPVDLLDSLVGNGNAADRDTVPVQKNVAARILLGAEDAVGGVRIADMKTQIEIALRIEPVKLVETSSTAPSFLKARSKIAFGG